MKLGVILEDENTYRDVLANQYYMREPCPFRLRGMQGQLITIFLGLTGSEGGLHERCAALEDEVRSRADEKIS